VKNGNETAADCGGSCDPCGVDKACKLGSDCQSLVCNLTCQAATCQDTVKNAAETGVDCGGGLCPKCPSGQGCKNETDCASTFCSKSPATAVTGTCRDPGCGDGFMNGSETDLDCGGSCAACPDLAHCSVNTDCQSLHCVGGICQEATCLDGIKNGPETDQDCGGGAHPNGEVCYACADGKACKVPSDCGSNVCTGSGVLTCQAPTCQDNTLNGDETVDPRTIVHRQTYSHPVFDAASLRAQERRAEISGVQRTWYCGAYWGYGFHEDGVQSAIALCNALERRGLPAPSASAARDAAPTDSEAADAQLYLSGTR